MIDLARKLYETLCAGVAMTPVPFDRLAPSQQAIYEGMEAIAATYFCGSDAATANAQRDALADAVAELLVAVEAERADRRDFEFSTAEAQQRKRRTTRLLGKVKAVIEEARR